MANMEEKNEVREFLKDFKLCKAKEKICNPVTCVQLPLEVEGEEGVHFYCNMFFT